MLNKLIKKLNKRESEFLLRAMRQHSNTYYEYKNGKEYDESLNVFIEFDANLFTQMLAKKIGLKEEL